MKYALRVTSDACRLPRGCGGEDAQHAIAYWLPTNVEGSLAVESSGLLHMYGVNGNCHREEKRNDVTDMWAPQRGVHSRASLDDGSAQRDYLE